ncbi:MAG TPA: GNAT family N-acetyltransferase [Acidimicrobiia bacterium]|nr:GNAT family N-acetyltransferase [Acidimicrobiia bacterium]
MMDHPVATPSTVQSRPLHGLADVMAVQRFLADIYARTGTSRAWEVRRWEGRFWHDDPVTLEAQLAEPMQDIRIWETPDGDIVGVAHPEDGGDVHLQVDPDHADIESEMLEWAEPNLRMQIGGGATRLTTFVVSGDFHRIQLLEARGYTREAWESVQRWRSLDTPPPELPDAEGYAIRSARAGDPDDAQRLADLINAAFGHSFDASVLLHFERAPSFVPDLVMIAEAPDGTFAAHAGIVIDRRNALAIVEPVCTHPDHRRRGLASACMAEGLRRAWALGATRATVSTGSDNPSNLVYGRLGFTEIERIEAWSRTWPA